LKLSDLHLPAVGILAGILAAGCSPIAITEPATPTAGAIAPAEFHPLTVHQADLLENLVDQPLPEVGLEVQLDYAAHRMVTHERIDFPNTSTDTWNEIVLDVPIHYIADTFSIDKMVVSTGGDRLEGVPGLFGQETMLHISLPHNLPPGESAAIDLDFTINLPPLVATDWPPNSLTGWSPDIIQAGEWYPAPIPYINGQGWHTWQYHPVGDPTIYPLSNISLTVHAPGDMTLASGGLDGISEDTWRFRVNAARGIALLASPRYQVAQKNLEGISLRSYYLPEHEQAGRDALEVAEKAIRLFDSLYGPYPYKSLTIAENGFFGGMEYSALVSITDWAYSHYHQNGDSVLHVLVAHEIAHQWWYGAVGNDQTTEPWLDESLAFYSELLYIEKYFPDKVEWWWKNRVDKYQPYGPVDATIYSYERSEYFIPAMYGQAARFIQQLRETMGDEAFFAFLTDYYMSHRGQTVTAKDFFETVRRHYAGDLSPLLRDYFANTEW
jgi:hypothetical protein